jgi:hypothetical protein
MPRPIFLQSSEADQVCLIEANFRILGLRFSPRTIA